MNNQKACTDMGLTQFELSKLVLRNLNTYKLSPTSKLVLLALVDRLPNIFPSQKTLADQLGVSIASVKRAISELRSQKIIITSNNEKYKTLDYKFTGSFYAQNKLTPEAVQNETSVGINLSDKEKKEETKKESFSLNKFSLKTKQTNPRVFSNTRNRKTANATYNHINGATYKPYKANQIEKGSPLDLPKNEAVKWYDNLPDFVKRNSSFAAQIKKKYQL